MSVVSAADDYVLHKRDGVIIRFSFLFLKSILTDLPAHYTLCI